MQRPVASRKVRRPGGAAHVTELNDKGGRALAARSRVLWMERASRRFFRRGATGESRGAAYSGLRKSVARAADARGAVALCSAGGADVIFKLGDPVEAFVVAAPLGTERRAG